MFLKLSKSREKMDLKLLIEIRNKFESVKFIFGRRSSDNYIKLLNNVDLEIELLHFLDSKQIEYEVKPFLHENILKGSTSSFKIHSVS